MGYLGSVREYVVNSGARKGEADESNCGADNGGRHQFADPCYTGELDYYRNDNVNQTC